MAKQTQTSDSPKAVVVREFRDIADFDKIHEVGDDVSHFDETRLATLVENGHVEIEEVVDHKAIEEAKKAEAKRLADEAAQQGNPPTA